LATWLAVVEVSFDKWFAAAQVFSASRKRRSELNNLPTWLVAVEVVFYVGSGAPVSWLRSSLCFN